MLASVMRELIEPKVSVDLETARALLNQVSDPQHCYLKVVGGDFLRHHPNPQDPLDVHALAGEPVRFSRMAAERVKERLATDVLRMDVDVVPVVDFFGEPIPTPV